MVIPIYSGYEIFPNFFLYVEFYGEAFDCYQLGHFAVSNCNCTFWQRKDLFGEKLGGNFAYNILVSVPVKMRIRCYVAIWFAIIFGYRNQDESFYRKVEI